MHDGPYLLSSSRRTGCFCIPSHRAILLRRLPVANCQNLSPFITRECFRVANVLPCRMLRRNQIARLMGKDLSSGPDRVPRPLCRSVWRWWWKKWYGRRAVSMRRRKMSDGGGGRECGVDCDEARWVQCCADGSVDGGQGFSGLLLMIACASHSGKSRSLPNFCSASLTRRSDDFFRASPQL